MEINILLKDPSGVVAACFRGNLTDGNSIAFVGLDRRNSLGGVPFWVMMLLWWWTR
jgi:hypothetical protein